MHYKSIPSSELLNLSDFGLWPNFQTQNHARNAAMSQGSATRLPKAFDSKAGRFFGSEPPNSEQRDTARSLSAPGFGAPDVDVRRAKRGNPTASLRVDSNHSWSFQPAVSMGLRRFSRKKDHSFQPSVFPKTGRFHGFPEAF